MREACEGWALAQCAAPKRERSPQHADLAHTSVARRGQGHAQKTIHYPCEYPNKLKQKD
ncbi:MAG: hypothetical protein NZ455_13185 [Bacteroidia bacterium]|nr:hypothetical protein [Bacteroidia bacterium]